MASIFGIDSAYGRFMNKVGDIILLSILWLVCSLPVVTMGTATCAAYYTAAKVLRHHSGYVSKEFFRSFRQNFRSSIGFNIVYLMLSLLLAFNYAYFNGSVSEVSFYLRCVYIIFGFVLLGLMLNTYILLSRFELGSGKLFHMAFVICFKHLHITMAFVIMCAAAAVLVYFMPWAVLILPGLVFFGMTFPAEHMMKKYMRRPENDSAQSDVWYYN